VAALLDVTGLCIQFPRDRAAMRVADNVSFRLAEGETLGLVGESGCGKSVTARALLRLVPPPGRIVSGRVLFQGTDLLQLPEREMRRYRGRRIALVVQEPMTALNPVFTVGYQIAEGPIVHGMMNKREALAEAGRLMDLVKIPDASRRVRDYPHQMSGGMRQRVLIAMALASRPTLLVADEPTTALDVTLQAEILDLLKRLKGEFGLSLLLISHNLGVIAETADRVAVMYAGRIVEVAPVRALFASPGHPYTIGLLRSVPRLGDGGAAENSRRRRLQAIEGNVPDLLNLPPGCAFHPRCPDVLPECRNHTPALRPLAGGEGARTVACFKHHDQEGNAR
jgi:peptide/nickel transport system ATP-binding protein/oligopeptide transport system ATP-binding protein